jgi:ABC-type siderophore export system fused ATPase/permease subunit
MDLLHRLLYLLGDDFKHIFLSPFDYPDVDFTTIYYLGSVFYVTALFVAFLTYTISFVEMSICIFPCAM